MGSGGIIKLPVIDMSDVSELKQGTLLWESVKKQVQESMEEYGCFEAKLDKTPPATRDSVFDGVKQLFDVPLEKKMGNREGKTTNLAYVDLRPLFESLAIDDALCPGEFGNFTDLNFRQNMEKYTEQLCAVDKIVRLMVLESVGMEQYMEEHEECMKYTMRFQKYVGPTSELPAHTDKGFLTILWQNHVNGLQVMTKDGHWFTLEPQHNSFIVMAGDAFYAWTNGRVRSCMHKVVKTGEDDRYSIGIFGFPRDGYVVKAPEEMVDEGHPLLFKPFDFAKFVAFYVTEAGLSSANPLKDYCGV